MPQLGVEDEVKSETIELQVVPRIGTGLAGPGRPLFLTARRFLAICKMIEAGARVTQACQQALVSYAGFRNHVARNPKYQKRLSKAEKIRDEVWKDYALEMIKQAMPKNWVAAMTYCERVYPNEFALRTVNREHASAEQPIGNEIPAERLAEYGKLMLEFAEENKAKQAQEIQITEAELNTKQTTQNV